MSLITVIGRGHSGTRAISHTLYASGVYMGRTLNASGDLVPAEAMYDACRIFANYVKPEAKHHWDFSAALEAQPPEEFVALVERYLASVLDRKASRAGEHMGWKLPETTLCFPWIIKMFPEAKYIFWIRDPRDSILASHLTDDLARFHVRYAPTKEQRLRRAISWKYQYDLVQATPRPRHWLEVRFEDFILKQEETLGKLEDFLDIKLARIIVRPDSIARWQQDEGKHNFDFFAPALKAYGYDQS